MNLINANGFLIPPEKEAGHSCAICKLPAPGSRLATIDFDGVDYESHETCVEKLPNDSVTVVEWAALGETDSDSTFAQAKTAALRNRISKAQIACPTPTT